MLAALLLAPLAAAPAQSFDPDPENQADRWLVVYHATWADENGNGVGDSEEVARHFARRRGVPATHLVGLNVSIGTSTVYSGQAGWEAFYDEVVLPLRAEVGLWPDDHILGFVFCYGFPYQINAPNYGPRGLDTTAMTLWQLGDRNAPAYKFLGHQDAYFDDAPTIGTPPGRFDPAVHRRQGMRTYLVARLDALDVEHAMELVDQALYGDAYVSPNPGYYGGNAYCDTRYGAYTAQDLQNYPYGHLTYGDADKDMAYGRSWLEQAGFPLSWEPYGTEIGEAGALWVDGTPADSAPDALWYEGWYNYAQYFDVWEWKPGSAACDLNSNSASRLREPAPNAFVSHAIQNGLTCGLGCVAEPYLNGHPYPEVFTYYLLNGHPFAEAARVSDPVSKWTQLYVGDPIYQPMRIGKVALLDTQPPPPSSVTLVEETATAGEWRLTTLLDTTGFLPDLGTLELHYGPDPNHGSVVSGLDDRPRLFHEAVIPGLGPDELVHYRADYTDPVGNVGPGTPFVFHTALASQPVLARVSSTATTVPAGTPFTVEAVVGAELGFGSLSSFSITVTAAHMGWNQLDLAPHFTGPAATITGSADDTIVSARLDVGATQLTPGTYFVEVSASSPAGSDADAITIVVT